MSKVTVATIDARAADDPAPLTNRELSWLEFNQRVLDQALGSDHPLLERVKFLAITASNLDEFFMVRVATLLRRRRLGLDHLSDDGRAVGEQLVDVRSRAQRMFNDVALCWNERLRPELLEHGIRLLEPEEFTDSTRRYLSEYFHREVYPLLTPLAFDPGHPFPLISNRSTNFAVVIRHARRMKFARVKVPPSLPRFVPVPPASASEAKEPHVFALLEDIIRLNLADLFSGLDVSTAHLFRVIRDSDIELPDDGADDLLESVDRSLKRLRHAPPCLLQVDRAMPRRVLNTLVENFEIEGDTVMRTGDRLGFSDWMALHRLPLPHLKDEPFVTRSFWTHAGQGRSVFDAIREKDHLVHHPFGPFGAVETFLHQAATDPNVVAIKMTLYRIGANSPLIDILISAADAGKEVAVLVELKARFDERNNIEWATRLEDAGVHVVYGVENLKTHCKLCMVVRRESDGIRRYAHLGTGNYNPLTAQIYTDLGLFTADSSVLDDVAEVFNYLTGYSRRREYKRLLVAPVTLRAELVRLIEREVAHAQSGRRARLIFKNNAITDVPMVKTLYRASQAGVDIDLIVRGACCLRPGIPQVSDRIHVRSVVGRFLEHSRLYYFENDGSPEVYLGSADLMERNLDRRVETLCPIRDGAMVRHLLDEVLETYLKDNTRAYELIDDQYQPVARRDSSTPINAQGTLLEWYRSARPDEGRDDEGV